MVMMVSVYKIQCNQLLLTYKGYSCRLKVLLVLPYLLRVENGRNNFNSRAKNNTHVINKPLPTDVDTEKRSQIILRLWFLPMYGMLKYSAPVSQDFCPPGDLPPLQRGGGDIPRNIALL
jgi:hypothetical protein